ncbi:MAG: hypothetical protein ABI220_05560 [Candidatus Saccharimonadales bacterium]
MTKLKFRCVHYSSTFYRGATVFLIVAFKSRYWFYKPVIWQLLSNGFNVYVYDYASKPLLESQPELWVKFSGTLNSDIKKNIERETGRDPRARFGIMGVSVGSSLALSAAKDLPELEKMLFVTMYGSSAQLVWENNHLMTIKRELVQSNKTMEDASRIFGPLEAVTELHKLGNRSIRMFVSMGDRVISFGNANRFIQAAIGADLNFSYRIVNEPKHSYTIIRVLADYSSWLPFMAELRDTLLVTKYEDKSTWSRLNFNHKSEDSKWVRYV